MTTTVTVDLRDRLVDALRLSPGRAPAAWSAELWRLVADALPPEPPAPGDRVRNGTYLGTLIAVHADYGWVLWDTTASPGTLALAYLARIDDEAGS